MDDEPPRRTRYRRQPVEPGAWWTAAAIYPRPDGRVYYGLKRAEGWPDSIRDSRGRRALEAFTALDLPSMASELSEYSRTVVGDGDRGWDEADAAARIDPLRDFALTFGPIGVDWGSRFRLSTASVRQLVRESGYVPRAQEQSMRRGDAARYAIVSFRGHGPGRAAEPVVRIGTVYPRMPVDQRRQLGDDALEHDDWAVLEDAQADLRHALAIAEAIARGSRPATRAAMLALLRDDNTEFDASDAGPWYTEYGTAITGFRPSTVFQPFRLPPHQVDWPQLARRFLGDLITRQIDFAVPLVQVDDSEAFIVRWRATSALEVIYLQLLGHVTKRPDFGIGTCKECGGAILRTRRPGRTEDQWHSGCQGGRVRAWRATRAKPT